jgi:hypothetical protein|nr:MAG TPA: hypothetical protein [Caudoviricetes sp.]
MDKFVVRFCIFGLNTYMLIVLIYALNGVDISEYDYLFTNSLLFGVLLTILSHTQGKYHCRWARFLCYNLVLVPIVNYIDCKYSIFDTAEEYIYFACGTLMFATISTIILAINHSRRARKVKKSRYKEYGIKR